MEKKYDLEDRLVQFACSCLQICELLPETKVAQNLVYQLSRSASSAALNYGEAQAAESPADFIHKLKLVLKEIRETRVNLRLIIETPVIKSDRLVVVLNECNQLMAIFLKSLETAKKNSKV